MIKAVQNAGYETNNGKNVGDEPDTGSVGLEISFARLSLNRRQMQTCGESGKCLAASDTTHPSQRTGYVADLSPKAADGQPKIRIGSYCQCSTRLPM